MLSIEELLKTDFVQALEKSGGKVYGVGGTIRDKYLGKESKDSDILVTKLSLEDIAHILKPFGKTDLVGESFGVIKFKPNDKTISESEPIDIAIPRKDTKIPGMFGHKAIKASSHKDISIEDDLFRRDATINSMAMDSSGQIIDPHGGMKDLENKVLRMTNPEAFADDPLRMLRFIQQASRFKLTIEPKTLKLIEENAHKIKEISGERMLIELDKLYKGDLSIGLNLLDSTGLYFAMFNQGFNKGLLSSLDRVKTIYDYYYILLPSPKKEAFIGVLKGDNKVASEIGALETLNAVVNTNNVDVKWAIFNVNKKNPEVLVNSGLLPLKVVGVLEEMKTNNEPLSMKELAITPTELQGMGYQKEELGKQIVKIITAIFSGELQNIKDSIIKFS